MICNTYVICKMLWCKDALHSDVCWGTSNPNFNFLQVKTLVRYQLFFSIKSVLLHDFKKNWILRRDILFHPLVPLIYCLGSLSIFLTLPSYQYKSFSFVTGLSQSLLCLCFDFFFPPFSQF